MNRDEVLAHLQAQANPESVAGMARYGINPDHALAGQLWDSGKHEARLRD
jgi:hypothetical protein